MATIVHVDIAVAFVSIVVVWIWWSNRNSLLTNWPFFGMIPSLLYNASQIHEFGTSILQQCNGTFLFKGPWFCGMDFLITSDPINFHHCFSKNFSNYPKGPEFNHIFEYLGDAIFNAVSDSWRIQRNMILSFFKDKRFELVAHTSIQQKISKGLFSVLDHAYKLENEVDFKDMFQRFTFDNICVLVLGMDTNTLSVDFPSAPFEKAFDDMAQVFFYRHMLPSVIWKLQRWLQIGEEKKMTRACHTFDHFVEQCIKRKQEQLQINRNIDQYDALMYFMDKNQEGSKLSNKFVGDMALNLLFAGRDTTSSFLDLLLIGTNPSAETSILKEIEQHFGNNINIDKLKFFDFEKLKKLTYVHGVLCEALRLYPSLPYEHKVSIEPDVLPGGHRIAKNTKILYSLYSMGRMKKIWGEDCLEFKPERWILENGGIKNYPSYKFIAFNAGLRTCLGKDLAFLQMKAVVCAVLWNYSLQLVEGQHACPSLSVIFHQKSCLKVRVSKRINASNYKF